MLETPQGNEEGICEVDWRGARDCRQRRPQGKLPGCARVTSRYADRVWIEDIAPNARAQQFVSVGVPFLDRRSALLDTNCGKERTHGAPNGRAGSQGGREGSGNLDTDAFR